MVIGKQENIIKFIKLIEPYVVIKKLQVKRFIKRIIIAKNKVIK